MRRPTAEEPTVAESTADDPKTEGPTTEGPTSEPTTAERPTTGEPVTEKPVPDRPGEDVAPLLAMDDEDRFRARWQSVQSKFVDDPRDAVRDADTLVTEVIQRLAATFADQKKDLEGQWNRGEQANTEDLRQALRHYRSFFNRLLVT